MKRNTALVKKLRQVTEEGHEGILEDIRKTNQSKARPLPNLSYSSCTYSSSKIFFNPPANPTSYASFYSDALAAVQYISEVVATLSEATFKPKDVNAAVQVVRDPYTGFHCGCLWVQYLF